MREIIYEHVSFSVESSLVIRGSIHGRAYRLRQIVAQDFSIVRSEKSLIIALWSSCSQLC